MGSVPRREDCSNLGRCRGCRRFGQCWFGEDMIHPEDAEALRRYQEKLEQEALQRIVIRCVIIASIIAGVAGWYL